MKFILSFLLFGLLFNNAVADARGPAMDFRNIKFEYSEGDHLFKNAAEAKEYQSLYDNNKETTEIKDCFESFEKKMKEKMQGMMQSGERPDMAKMQTEKEDNQKQLLKEVKSVLEKKKKVLADNCVGTNQSKVIEKPAIDSLNDAKKAASVVMTQEELAKMKEEIKEEVKKELMKDMPGKMAESGRRPPQKGPSEDNDSPFADPSSFSKKGKRPSRDFGGDSNNMSSIGMGQYPQMQQGQLGQQGMQQGQNQNYQSQQQIMSQFQVPQINYQMNSRMNSQMPQGMGQNFSMFNGGSMGGYGNINGNYQMQRNYGQSSMQQNPYMMSGYSQQQMPQYYFAQNNLMSSGMGMTNYYSQGNQNYSTPFNSYMQYGGSSQIQQNPYMMMGR